MWDEIGALHDYHRDVPADSQLLKLMEEMGEVAQAWIGVQGHNRRKGIYATDQDVLAELADVIITAAVAMAGITQDARRAGESFQQRLATVVTRAGLDIPASTVRHWTASAIVLHPDDEQVLLIDHIKSGLALFAGGHVEPGEALHEAALREVREETGIDARIITGPEVAHPPMTVHPVPFRINEGLAADPVNGDHRHIDAIYVCCAITSTIGQLDQREVTGARWVTLDAMRDLPVPPELPGLTEAAIAWATDAR
jgi:8-oxo-dGTP pyrophosphatase MutT (NUDIX family)/NTP pyrophosphatase (non-canonical NTP hydrolase)